MVGRWDHSASTLKVSEDLLILVKMQPLISFHFFTCSKQEKKHS